MSDDRFDLFGGVFLNSAGVLKDEELSMIIKVFESNQSYSRTIHGVSGQDETLSAYCPTECDGIFKVKCERSCDKQLDQLALASTGGSLQVIEQSDHGQSESVEPRRVSLDWDNAFFTSAGLLSDEELSMINKGFKTPASQSESSYESRACGLDQTSSSDSDEYDLQALEQGLFKDVTPYSRTYFGDKKIGNLVQIEALESRRQSLDWDTAFLTSSGLLNNEELSMINKRSVSNQYLSGTRIGVQPLRVSGLAQTSSLHNDGFDLEALEFGLFKDITREAMKDIISQKENLCISEVKCHELPRTPSVNKISGKLKINHCLSESVESRRVSLDWDSVFFTSAGLLKDKELSVINKGFTKPKSNKLDSNRFFDLEDLEADLFKYVKKPSLCKLTKRSKLATNVGGRGCGQVTPSNTRPSHSPSSVLSPLLLSSICSASSSFHDATSASITKIKSSGLKTSSYSPLQTSVAKLFNELQH